MRKILNNSILILLVKIFLGGLFIIASLDKIADPNAFSASILNYKMVGTTLAMSIATILPWLELLCGLGLILGIYPKASSLIITFLLIGFSTAIIVAILRGFDISCGCFTQDPSVNKIGYQKILENCGLIVLGIYLFFFNEQSVNLLLTFKRVVSKI